MKSDIQIAQEASMLPIQEVASSLGIREDELFFILFFCFSDDCYANTTHRFQ